ncbi:MAG: molecular chaperone HtpG [Spirochaetes bacterium]|nr:molecular chaperone HtpG [Spirochaetota bacterium]
MAKKSDSSTSEKGQLSIHADNILPIIKKWLYSDKEIFVRELIANAVDACAKLKHLSLIGEYKDELGELEVDVKIDKKKSTLSFNDNGIGMTRDEVKKYINQIAFSGAEDFISKYKDNKEENQIIGHFGLGFYSSFMVSDEVEIITKSYLNEPAVHWDNKGNHDFTLEDTDKKDRGTEVILHINKDEKEFLEEHTIREIIQKYCNFLPYPIKLNGNIINDQHPLWLKAPRDVKEEDYKEFYKKLFPFEEDPMFWIHLDVEVPFRLKGILYFPKIKHELDSSKGRIKLYCSQVFVSDNAKEIIPEFLTLLQGTLDIPDLPLNVSRSYLQNDPYVRKISEHITRKVADKLTDLFKKDRATFEKDWEGINIFVKFGMMRDEKFYERVKDTIIFKTTDGVYKTLEEYKEKNKGILKEKNGRLTILYASDEKEQATYINMIKAQGMEALVLNTMIDVHFIQFLEMKDNKISFSRIDSDAHDSLTEEESNAKIKDGDNKTSDDKIREFFEKELKENNEKLKDKIKIEVKPLKTAETPAIIVLSEFMRRFKEMSFMQKKFEEDEDVIEDHTLIVNSNNEFVKKLLSLSENSENADKIKNSINHIYDLALLAQNKLKGERLIKFIERSNDILKEI